MDVLRRVYTATPTAGEFIGAILRAAQLQHEKLNPSPCFNVPIQSPNASTFNKLPRALSQSQETDRSWAEVLVNQVGIELRHFLDHAIVGLRDDQFDFSMMTSSSPWSDSSSGGLMTSSDAVTSPEFRSSAERPQKTTTTFAHQNTEKRFKRRDIVFTQGLRDGRRKVRAKRLLQPDGKQKGGIHHLQLKKQRRVTALAQRQRASSAQLRRKRRIAAQRRSTWRKEHQFVFRVASFAAHLLQLTPDLLKPRDSQQAIVGTVIGRLTGTTGPNGARNVLTLGFQKQSQQFGTVAAAAGAAYGVVANYPNSMMLFVQNSVCFRELHSLIGDELLSFVVSRLSIFVCCCDQSVEGDRERRDAFVQISGFQISAVSRHPSTPAPSNQRASTANSESIKRKYSMQKKRSLAATRGTSPVRKRRRADKTLLPAKRSHTRRGVRGGAKHRNESLHADGGNKISDSTLLPAADETVKNAKPKRRRRKMSSVASLNLRASKTVAAAKDKPKLKKKQRQAPLKKHNSPVTTSKPRVINRNAVMYRFSHKNKPRTDFLFALCDSMRVKERELALLAQSSPLPDAFKRNNERHVDALMRFVFADEMRNKTLDLSTNKRRPERLLVRDSERMRVFKPSAVLQEVFRSFSNCPKSLRPYRHMFAELLARFSKIAGLLSSERANRSNPLLFLLNLHCPIIPSGSVPRKSLVPTRNLDGAQQRSMIRAAQTQASHDTQGDDMDSAGLLVTRSQVARRRMPSKNSEYLSSLTDTEIHRRYCSHRQVCTFAWSFLERVIPREMRVWTSTRFRSGNPAAFKAMVFRFVCLKKFEKMSLPQLLSGLKLQQMFVSSGRKSVELSFSQSIVEAASNFICFIFFDLLFPLIKHNFYVTEVGDQRNRVVYYRKEVWAELQRRAMRSLSYRPLQTPATGQVRGKRDGKRRRTSSVTPDVSTADDALFKKLDRAEVLTILAQRDFGYAVMRLLPKSLSADSSKTGIRPILNFAKRETKAPYGIQGRTNKLSINQLLHNDFFIMNFERTVSKSEFGASVFNFDEIYERVCAFLELKDARIDGGRASKLYMCSVDIRRSFDSISQPRVFGALEKLIGNEDWKSVADKRYTIMRWSVLRSLEGRLCAQYKKQAFEHSELPATFFEFLRVADGGIGSAAAVKHGVLSDNVQYPSESARSVLQRECQLIFQNIVQHNGAFYKQVRGIAQGSVLSSHLCSLTYGQVENEGLYGLPGIRNSTRSAAFSCGDDDVALGMLVRFIDDFFYVSTDKNAVEELIGRLELGFPDFGCVANAKKTKASFTLRDGRSCPGIDTNQAGSFMPWCGFLINISTFQFQHDFSRLVGSAMRETLNVDTHASPGLSLERKLLKFARYRCIPLLLDARINGIDTVRLNIFQSFCACAIRFHLGVCALPRGPTPERRKSRARPNRFFVRLVLNIVETMFDYISRVVGSPVATKMKCVCPISQQEVRWLGFTAFLRILRRKQTRHAAVLEVITRKIQTDPQMMMMNRSPHLLSAIDPRRSSVFARMEY